MEKKGNKKKGMKDTEKENERKGIKTKVRL